MARLLIGLLFAFSAVAAAEGPGTRIRAGSDMPRVPQSAQRQDGADACARLRGAQRERCLGEQRKAADTGRASGPGSTGMGSGAGSSSGSGTSGGGSFGAAAPR